MLIHKGQTMFKYRNVGRLIEQVSCPLRVGNLKRESRQMVHYRVINVLMCTKTGTSLVGYIDSGCTCRDEAGEIGKSWVMKDFEYYTKVMDFIVS